MTFSLCDAFVLFMGTWPLISTKKDNIVEAEMQLVMWYRREGGRGQ